MSYAITVKTYEVEKSLKLRVALQVTFALGGVKIYLARIPYEAWKGLGSIKHIDMAYKSNLAEIEHDALSMGRQREVEGSVYTPSSVDQVSRISQPDEASMEISKDAEGLFTAS